MENKWWVDVVGAAAPFAALIVLIAALYYGFFPMLRFFSGESSYDDFALFVFVQCAVVTLAVFFLIVVFGVGEFLATMFLVACSFTVLSFVCKKQIAGLVDRIDRELGTDRVDEEKAPTREQDSKVVADKPKKTSRIRNMSD